MPDISLPPQTVAADGTATVSWRTTGKQYWTVRQVTTKADNVGSGATCELRKNKSRITLMIPTGSTAGGDPPVDQNPADTMDVRWTNAVVGSIVEVTAVLYDVKGQ